MEEPTRLTRESRSSKQDESIMGTNNSSIISKRSVERLYSPNEPHFYRYFVKKPHRRAPLINRGYWLRMKAVDHVVHHFLNEVSEKKIIINLGCGYDPLPWQCLSKYPAASRGVKFIDVDYKDLMLKKRMIVQQTPELHGQLTGMKTSDSEVLLHSDPYIQLGCDLRDVSSLSRALSSVVDLETSLVLLISEVAITYINIEAANTLIGWAATLPHARFCLLEQLLSGGGDHPFAKTMMAHFDKLKTPLRSIQFYPTIRHQQQRFEDAGWTDVWAKNLWELWASEFLTSEERTSLDEIEPFDEWEEFALFGCHYVLLLAKNDSCPDTVAPKHAIPAEGQLRKDVLVVDNTRFSAYANSGGYRRFAASLPMRGTDHYEGLIGCFGGMGLNTRLKSIDIYSKTALDSTVLDERSRLQAPSARICHTITDLGEAGAVLIGGRASPDQAFTDCWLYNKWKNAWERLKDLPQPRYRHSAVLLRKDMILIMGGKRDSKTIIWEPLLWNREFGWRNCSLKLSGLTDGLPAVFGAILAVTKERPCQGIFTGGMLQDGVINRNTWYWTLNDTDSSSAIMDFKQATSSPGYERPPLDRFGATVISQERRTVVIGGITPDHLIEPQDEIVSLEGVQNEDLSNSHTVDRLLTSSLRPRPLLIGCSARQSEHELVLMGGGAVCFSMGTFWNSGCYTLPIGGGHISEQCHTHNQEPNSWHYSRTIEIPNGSPFLPKRRAPTASGARAVQRLIVDHEIVDTTAEFSEIVKRGKPAVFPNVDLGSCTQAWSSSYLTNRVGRDRRIVVHKASTEHMDFVSKNFDYVKMSFGDFTDAIDKGERLYLRSLSSNKPSELPADIFEDYPTICNDFRLPPAFQQVIENAHSSPLRISGPVTMWLHYDVMANVLCQIRGSKHLLLFPPADLQHFDFAPGASSSSMDVFHMLDDARLAQTRPHEATLNAGDVLFIPPLWLHTAKPTEEVSINVNIFFRNFRHGYAIGRDVYGNRDLAAYEKGRKDISKIAKSFDGLPADVRGFYLLRLAQELHVEAETLIDCE